MQLSQVTATVIVREDPNYLRSAAFFCETLKSRCVKFDEVFYKIEVSKRPANPNGGKTGVADCGAVLFVGKMTPDVPMKEQERAWTLPIRYERASWRDL